MLDVTILILEAATSRLVEQYRRIYGRGEPDHARTIATAVRLALERLGFSDALYHDVEHTVMVAMLGTEILRGREIAERVTPEDWLHMTVALLCHDVGYVRGACRGDTATEVVINAEGEKRQLPRGASDAWLTPYHVDRSKLFIHERAEILGPVIDPERVAAAIELTRFPVPADQLYQATANEGGLVRAADLIGQLADPNYLRKQNALFHELVETGSAEKLALSSPADLSEGYVAFFWKQIEPYIGDALRYLALTAEGRQWTANLYAQVFTVEHHRWHMGAHRGAPTHPAPPA